jgi:DNA-binding HxlR family transcriptional regulator
MRSYGQYCTIARALDVVGERWALLIVRELLQQGPCRFTDLKNGLPGIATNLLSGRLKELEDEGLVSREEAPPPVATTLYALTEEGRALEPVLKALGDWGRHLMVVEKPGDAFRANWLASAAASFVVDGDPEAGPVVIQLIAAGRAAFIEVGGGGARAGLGRAAAPELTLEGPPRLVLGLLAGMIDLRGAIGSGLVVTGNSDILDRIRNC